MRFRIRKLLAGIVSPILKGFVERRTLKYSVVLSTRFKLVGSVGHSIRHWENSDLDRWKREGLGSEINIISEILQATSCNLETFIVVYFELARQFKLLKLPGNLPTYIIHCFYRNYTSLVFVTLLLLLLIL